MTCGVALESALKDIYVIGRVTKWMCVASDLSGTGETPQMLGSRT